MALLDFRRQKFEIKDHPALKRKLLEYTEGYFYQDNGNATLSVEDKKIFAKVFNWLLGTNCDIHANRGLLLTGKFGTGKSVLLKAILHFIREHYSDLVLENGIPKPYYITSHALAGKFADYQQNEYEINKLKTNRVLAIDDIGWEPVEVNCYGTRFRPLEETLMERYDSRRPVLMTSNLTLDLIGQRYGEHIKDRLRQMVYVVEFNGESKRS